MMRTLVTRSPSWRASTHQKPSAVWHSNKCIWCCIYVTHAITEKKSDAAQQSQQGEAENKPVEEGKAGKKGRKFKYLSSTLCHVVRIHLA